MSEKDNQDIEILREILETVKKVHEGIHSIHVALLYITENSVDVNVRKWDSTGKFQTCHNHSGDPKKDDIRTGN